MRLTSFMFPAKCPAGTFADVRQFTVIVFRLRKGKEKGIAIL